MELTVVEKGTEAGIPDKPDKGVEKIIVAVHGIGDQTNYATIRSTLNQFCRFRGESGGVPLGRFHIRDDEEDDASEGVSPYLEMFKSPRLVFTEVYWAHIPRKIATEHKLEETKMWVKTIIERAQTNQKKDNDPNKLSEDDFVNIDQVLLEMLSALGVLERVCFLAEKAGLFTFDLNKVLVDYVNDVQVVTEFGSSRQTILGLFAKLMDKVHRRYPNADIYLVAHSEGSVVSFLGLLEAICRNNSDWIKSVRGFMTIGSPIDTHLLLWPELFKDYGKRPEVPVKAPIVWRNYYDRGDPIGDKLDTTRQWLRDKWGEQTYEKIFDFKGEEGSKKQKESGQKVPDDSKGGDYGFVRYPLPGKAHNDYWKDDGVFGHFIKNVVCIPTQNSKGRKPKSHENPPGDKYWWKYTNWWLPYVAGLIVLFTGVFVLCKAIVAFSPGLMKVTSTPTSVFPPILWETLALTIILAGLTVMTRIFRLTGRWKFRIGGIVVFLLSAFAYREIRYWNQDPNEHWAMVLAVVAIAVVYLAWFHLRSLVPTLQRWGTLGVKTLLTIGSLGIVIIAGFDYKKVGANQPDSPIWPLFLAGALFLYLWWLAIHIFDLTFIWHRYIRTSEAKNTLKQNCTYEKPAPAQAVRRTA
jgi:hypothetical protein